MRHRALAHIQAGDRSGHIDDMTRMTLAKLAHLHFPATKKAFDRLINLGEEKKSMFRAFATRAKKSRSIAVKTRRTALNALEQT